MKRARSDLYEEEPSRTAEMAHVEDRVTFTGLYDHLGQEIHRQPAPFGFDPNRWETKPVRNLARKTKTRA